MIQKQERKTELALAGPLLCSWGKSSKSWKATEGFRQAAGGMEVGGLYLIYIVKNSLWLQSEEHLAWHLSGYSQATLMTATVAWGREYCGIYYSVRNGVGQK